MRVAFSFDLRDFYYRFGPTGVFGRIAAQTATEPILDELPPLLKLPDGRLAV
jgi:hypothetical protein